MKNFPNINENQYVIVMADGKTGNILNISKEWSLDNNHSIFSIFNSIDEALNFIGKDQTDNDWVEYIIYDKNQSVVKYIEAIKWS
ncbi:hypothetical protein [Chryseobacterium sp.]|uniref:hypothetical protein n=1 Tax=Chryseobacterium sp. TaxID=1871047 RepID=UPI000ECA4D1F|nr:hypothetical protein [Chryseobacterium sp.]HCM34705.1 hypothetical protein [Chryseobacterium sp.]